MCLQWFFSSSAIASSSLVLSGASGPPRGERGNATRNRLCFVGYVTAKRQATRQGSNYQQRRALTANVALTAISEGGFSSGGFVLWACAILERTNSCRRWLERMVTIARDNDVVTLINVFTVAQEDQQRLVDVLVDATQKVMRKQPGFVSANIHRSLDGTRVTNYAQWQSREAFEAMLHNQEAAEHMGEAARIAERFEPHLYEVSFVDEV
jgi:heme-degrading monooxygenase HmoA